MIHFNDFHGQILTVAGSAMPGGERRQLGGLARLAGYVAMRRGELGERLWVTNGGDWFQGTPEGLEGRGAAVLAALDDLSLTASVIGNHEYDWGEAHLFTLVDRIRHPVLGANIFERGQQRLRPYVRPYLVKLVETAAGTTLRVALVGLNTFDTPNVSTGPFGQAEFRDEEATLRGLLPALSHDTDAIVLLTHCGLDRDVRLARLFPQVAVILGGHSHSEVRRPLQEGKTTIVQSGSRARAVTEVALNGLDDAPYLQLAAFRFVELDAEVPSDPSVQLRISERFGHLAETWDTPLGEVTGAADRRRGAHATPGGSFVAGLIRAAGAAAVGITNKGGIRTELRAGRITRRQVFELLPFDNTVVTLEMTGDQLRGVLQQGLESGRQPLEIDGATYRYRVAAGTRELVDVAVGGAPLEPNAIYAVATNSFLAAGGDGFSTLREVRRVRETATFLRDLVVEHLAQSGKIVLQDDMRIGVLP